MMGMTLEGWGTIGAITGILGVPLAVLAWRTHLIDEMTKSPMARERLGKALQGATLVTRGSPRAVGAVSASACQRCPGFSSRQYRANVYPARNGGVRGGAASSLLSSSVRARGLVAELQGQVARTRAALVAKPATSLVVDEPDAVMAKGR